MLLVTCPYGLSSVLHNEIKKLWYTASDVFDTWLFIDVWVDDAYFINLHSRIANKVFLRVTTPDICTNFDDLFDQTELIDRSKYIGSWQGISVKLHLRQSQIDSAKSWQSIIHKAILTKLTWSKSKERMIENDWHTHTIFVVINKDICSVYINTSGASLHERWYREHTGEAPIKENIAAALVQLANRKYSEPLFDPCCGSGTLCIEAAMIARNIAPGLDRYFAFEKFPSYKKEIFEEMRKKAESSTYEKKYTIIWSDIDEEMIKIAKINAKHAWVVDTIQFKYGDILDQENREIHLAKQNHTIICNPPYWIRLSQENVSNIHHALSSTLSKKSVVITGYEWAKNIFSHSKRSQKKCKNWPEDVTIFISKN